MPKTSKTLSQSAPLTKQHFKPLKLNFLENLNLYQLNLRSLKSIDDSQLSYGDDDNLNKVISDWRTATALFQKAINQDRGKELTRAIQEANKLRNGDFAALKKTINAFKISKRPSEAAAYQALNPIMKPFKDCNKLDYAKESIQLEKLLTLLDDKALAPHLSELGLTRFVTNLKESQAQFEQVFASSTDSKANQTRYNTAQIRKELIIYYQRVLTLLELMADIRTEAIYGQLIALLNGQR